MEGHHRTIKRTSGVWDMNRVRKRIRDRADKTCGK